MSDELKLDPASFERLSPTEQGIALLCLLFMESKGMTLEDLREEIEAEKKWGQL